MLLKLLLIACSWFGSLLKLVVNNVHLVVCAPIVIRRITHILTIYCDCSLLLYRRWFFWGNYSNPSSLVLVWSIQAIMVIWCISIIVFLLCLILIGSSSLVMIIICLIIEALWIVVDKRTSLVILNYCNASLYCICIITQISRTNSNTRCTRPYSNSTSISTYSKISWPLPLGAVIILPKTK